MRRSGAGWWADPVADRQMREARHQVRGGALRRARELHVLEARQQLAEQRPRGLAREVRAEAEVLAHAEGEVRVRVAVEAEQRLPLGVRVALLGVGPRLDQAKAIHVVSPFS